MSDLPTGAAEGGEELDLEIIEDGETEDETDDVGADGAGDGSGDDGAAEGQEEGQEPQQEVGRRGRPRGRPFGEQIRELQAQRAADKAEYDRRLAEIQARPQQADPQAQARADQEFWASLEMMSPAEAHRMVYQRARQEIAQQLVHQQVATQEAIDRQAYEAAAQSSRVHQQYRERVEALVASERARGNTLPREVALKFLYGGDGLERTRKGAPAQQRQAQQRVARQVVRPSTGRGEVPRTGIQRSQDADDEALLRGIRMDDI